MKISKAYRLIIVCMYCVYLISCNPKNSFLLYQNDGKHLLIDSYRLSGTKNMTSLAMRKYYTKDTIAHGAEIHYDSSGQIEKWLWFDKHKPRPLFGIYFNKDQSFDTMIGDPFIRSIITQNDQLAVEVVNPPNVKYFIGYRDFIGDKIVNKKAYEPGLTDSTSWATFQVHDFEPGHVYKVYYYILDKQGNRIDSMSRELVAPHKD